MGITIYGIKNCDTMKKARAWLDNHGVAYDFHDYKSDGIAKDKLKQWSAEVGWETLLNRAGTTFKKLPDADKAGTEKVVEQAPLAGVAVSRGHADAVAEDGRSRRNFACVDRVCGALEVHRSIPFWRQIKLARPGKLSMQARVRNYLQREVHLPGLAWDA